MILKLKLMVEWNRRWKLVKAKTDYLFMQFIYINTIYIFMNDEIILDGPT